MSKELAEELAGVVATANDFKTSLNHRDVGAWLMCNADRLLAALNRPAPPEMVGLIERVTRYRDQNFSMRAGPVGFQLLTDVLQALSAPPELDIGSDTVG